jgi:flagellar protein FlgJ
MAAFALPAVPVDALAGAGATPTAAEMAKRADIKKTAQNFEASFLNIMMQSMFKDVKVGEPFGGGEGEDVWKSFMTDAVAKQMAKAGGIGLASSVTKEMLKLQGLN